MLGWNPKSVEEMIMKKKIKRLRMLKLAKAKKKIRIFVLWMMYCFWLYPLGYTDILSEHLSIVVPPDALLLQLASLQLD